MPKVPRKAVPRPVGKQRKSGETRNYRGGQDHPHTFAAVSLPAMMGTNADETVSMRARTRAEKVRMI